jgi:hypothetical protein
MTRIQLYINVGLTLRKRGGNPVTGIPGLHKSIVQFRCAHQRPKWVDWATSVTDVRVQAKIYIKTEVCGIVIASILTSVLVPAFARCRWEELEDCRREEQLISKQDLGVFVNSFFYFFSHTFFFFKRKKKSLFYRINQFIPSFIIF